MYNIYIIVLRTRNWEFYITHNQFKKLTLTFKSTENCRTREISFTTKLFHAITSMLTSNVEFQLLLTAAVIKHHNDMCHLAEELTLKMTKIKCLNLKARK